jgi:hypothetical protein
MNTRKENECKENGGNKRMDATENECKRMNARE